QAAMEMTNSRICAHSSHWVWSAADAAVRDSKRSKVAVFAASSGIIVPPVAARALEVVSTTNIDISVLDTSLWQILKHWHLARAPTKVAWYATKGHFTLSRLPPWPFESSAHTLVSLSPCAVWHPNPCALHKASCQCDS